MCGVVGYYTNLYSDYHTDALKALVKESKIRGLHAFGIAAHEHNGDINVGKFFNLDELLEYINTNHFLDAIIHTRYSTSGDWLDMGNNQPIVANDKQLVFNGVISMETKEQMESSHNIKLDSDNDGELFLRSDNRHEFVIRMTGSFAGLWYDKTSMFAARNERRPLWYTFLDEETLIIASTKDIIARALGSSYASVAFQFIPDKLHLISDFLL